MALLHSSSPSDNTSVVFLIAGVVPFSLYLRISNAIAKFRGGLSLLLSVKSCAIVCRCRKCRRQCHIPCDISLDGETTRRNPALFGTSPPKRHCTIGKTGA